MGEFIGGKLVKLLIKKGLRVSGSKCLILGITFKENCPDIRNTRVVDIISELEEYGVVVDIHDPWADKEEVKKELGLELAETIDMDQYDSIVLAVSHEEFVAMDWSQVNDKVIFDVKSILPREIVQARL